MSWSTKRLRERGLVITLDDVAEITGSAENARKRASDWQSRGLIESVGRRVGIYYNRVAMGTTAIRPVERAAEVYLTRRADAGRAVVCGTYMLGSQAAKFTNHPGQMQIAIPDERAFRGLRDTAVAGLRLVRRPSAWFERVRPIPLNEREVGAAFPTLSLGWSIADQWIHAESSEISWEVIAERLEDDDLDAREIVSEIEEAVAALGPLPASKSHYLDRLREELDLDHAPGF